MRKYLSTALLTLATVACAQAALIVYEGFDYQAGANLATQSGGTYTNWGEPATVSVVGPATFGTLLVSGNGGSFGDNQQNFGSSRDSGVGVFETNSTYYMSGLFRYSGTIDWGNGGVAAAGLTYSTGTNTEGITFGLGYAGGSSVVAYAGYGYTWRMTDGKAVSGALSAGTTYLLVAKFTHDGVVNGGGNIGSVSLAVYDTSVPVTESYDFTLANLNYGSNYWPIGNNLSKFVLGKGNSAGAALVDEIRIGTTWAEVVAVPEPSAVALLLGVAGLGAVLVRRRRA